MAKPTTGRVGPAEEPEADPERMMAEAWMTSVFTGITLIVATAYFAAIGGMLLLAGHSAAGPTGARIGLGLGLGLALALAIYLLRASAGRLKSRSVNVYRGAWIGTFLSFGLIIVMAYAPWLVPNYCPPGAIC